MQGAVAPAAPSVAVTEIIELIVQPDNRRAAEFSGYTGMRHCRFENKKGKMRAECYAAALSAASYFTTAPASR